MEAAGLDAAYLGVILNGRLFLAMDETSTRNENNTANYCA